MQTFFPCDLKQFSCYVLAFPKVEILRGIEYVDNGRIYTDIFSYLLMGVSFSEFQCQRIWRDIIQLTTKY